jgi:hypothetical protein
LVKSQGVDIFDGIERSIEVEYDVFEEGSVQNRTHFTKSLGILRVGPRVLLFEEKVDDVAEGKESCSSCDDDDLTGGQLSKLEAKPLLAAHSQSHLMIVHHLLNQRFSQTTFEVPFQYNRDDVFMLRRCVLIIPQTHICGSFSGNSLVLGVFLEVGELSWEDLLHYLGVIPKSEVDVCVKPCHGIVQIERPESAQLGRVLVPLEDHGSLQTLQVYLIEISRAGDAGVAIN